MVDETRQINSANPQRGAEFERLVRELFREHEGIALESSQPVLIGDPPKAHRFDLVSTQHRVVIECKNHTWTRSNNVPSAKITTLREAVFFLRLAPAGYRRILAMKRQTHSGRTESLAEYFVRLNSHLLGDVEVVEIEEQTIRRLTRT